MTNGNIFAAIAILLWPVVAFLLYATRPLPQATLWTVLGGVLLLPAGVAIKIEMIPAIDKFSVPNLCALIGVMAMARGAARVRVRWGLTEVLLLCFVLSPLVTSMLNSDAILVGGRVLPGVGPYDGISTVLSQGLLILSFIVGRRVFRHTPATEVILTTTLVAGLFYALPMLFEIRFSPQLARWIYGFSPTSFAVEMRYGGFRPVVFMQNGLTAAFFLATSFVAAVALGQARATMPLSARPALVQAFLGVVIVLCKSAGALVYAVVAGLVMRWLSPRAQMRIAIACVVIGLCYPLLRFTDQFPTQALLQTAAAVNQERADSLQFRFREEEQLLAHAAERMFFGWGRFGRNRVYSETSGEDASVTDGMWIITLGQFGLVGFFAQFGLLSLPVFRAYGALKRCPTRASRILLAGLAMTVAFSVIEQLPNASISSWTWLQAGALLGIVEAVGRSSRRSSVTAPVRREQKLVAAAPAAEPAL
jgi:hypothetical protein